MIETENTPNPDTLKFLSGKKVSEIGPIEFLKNDKSIKVPLASKILSLEGAVMVFFGEDFITVKKEKNLNWKDFVTVNNKNFLRPSEVRNLLGDSSKAKKLLKWKPKYNLDDLCKDMLLSDLKLYGMSLEKAKIFSNSCTIPKTIK